MSIRLDRDGAVATITIDRPEARNALRREDLAAIKDASDGLQDRGLRAVTLRAAGEKVFSAGVDFAFAVEPESGAMLTAAADALAAVPVPVIAVLAGSVHGGAAELVAACDFRIGAEGVGLSIPPAKLGLHYELPGMRRIAALVGHQAARRLFVGAESLPTRDLLRVGFLDAAVPPAELEAAVADRLAALTALAPLAVRGMKATLGELAAGGDPEAAARRVAACRASADFAEGIDAVRTKRKPSFRGS